MGKTVTATDLLRAGRRTTDPASAPRRSEVQATSQLVASTPSKGSSVADPPPIGEQLDALTSERVSAWTAEVERLDAQSSSQPANTTPPLQGDTTERLVAPAQLTYERATTFLTADQRRWLKDTSRSLPVDGLSASDIVRLAVSRLRGDIEDGLELVDALSAQAHEEAATHPGRRNRGLPPHR